MKIASPQCLGNSSPTHVPCLAMQDLTCMPHGTQGVPCNVDNGVWLVDSAACPTTMIPLQTLYIKRIQA